MIFGACYGKESECLSEIAEGVIKCMGTSAGALVLQTAGTYAYSLTITDASDQTIIKLLLFLVRMYAECLPKTKVLPQKT